MLAKHSRGIVYASCHLDLPNFSCHLPFAAGAGAALPASAISSTVSWTVAMAATPGSGIWLDSCCASATERRTRAFEVFFCRSEYVLSAVFNRPAVGDDSRVRLVRLISSHPWLVSFTPLPLLSTYVGGLSDSRRVTSSGGNSMSLYPTPLGAWLRLMPLLS